MLPNVYFMVQDCKSTRGYHFRKYYTTSCVDINLHPPLHNYVAELYPLQQVKCHKKLTRTVRPSHNLKAQQKCHSECTITQRYCQRITWSTTVTRSPPASIFCLNWTPLNQSRQVLFFFSLFKGWFEFEIHSRFANYFVKSLQSA